MLAASPQRRSELQARAVRDNLADCLSTLPALIQRDDPASLHFWFANFDGMRREIFPWLVHAYERWQNGYGQGSLREAIAAGREHWHRVGEGMLDAYRRGDSAAVPILTAPS
jgi:hypothetical protein